MEQQWNYTDWGKPKDSEKILSQCHFLHHKSLMDCPGTIPGLHIKKPDTNRLSYGTVGIKLGPKIQYIFMYMWMFTNKLLVYNNIVLQIHKKLKILFCSHFDHLNV
jgi:hypothetical protein